MISAPMFATRNDQMICCSHRRWMCFPLTLMRLGGVSLGALSGLPPSPLFFSELLILAGGFASGQYLVAAATALLLGLGFVGLAHQLIEALLGRSHRVAALTREAA